MTGYGRKKLLFSALLTAICCYVGERLADDKEDAGESQA